MFSKNVIISLFVLFLCYAEQIRSDYPPSNSSLCIQQLESVYGECNRTFYERLSLNVNNDDQILSVQVDAYDCCAYTAFEYCLNYHTNWNCSDEVATVINKKDDWVIKYLDTECSEYELYTATCLAAIYSWPIVVGFIIFSVIVIAFCVFCCVCACSCFTRNTSSLAPIQVITVEPSAPYSVISEYEYHPPPPAYERY